MTATNQDDYTNASQRAYEEYWVRQMADPEFRRVYDEEAAKKDLWLQLVEARQAAGIARSKDQDGLMNGGRGGVKRTRRDPNGIAELHSLDRLADAEATVDRRLEAAGLLAPPPLGDDLPTGEALQALEREYDAWATAGSAPIGFSGAVLEDRR